MTPIPASWARTSAGTSPAIRGWWCRTSPAADRRRAQKRHLDLEPEAGEYLDRVIRNLSDAPEAIVEKARILSKP